MSMQQRNTVVSLVIFLLILAFFGLRIFQMVQTETFIAANVFQLWGIVIVAAVLVTVVGIILTTIGSAVVYSVKNNAEPPAEEYLEDERDKLIDLKGTKVTYLVSSLGSLIAMIVFVLNQAPLTLFSLLVAVGLVAQIAGDAYRLIQYGSGS